MERKTLTTSTGAPVDDNQNSQTAGPRGPILLQDFHLIDKLAKFDRERIPERVVHAKGSGAHGYFEVTADVTKWCKAKFLNQVGKRTPLFVRFSTVAGEKGSSDAVRDPRGFAIKFYTEEGIYDMVGNNTPVFFIRDPIKFPDFIHSQKKHPGSGYGDANMRWDFWNYSPEALHQVMILFSDRGTPDGYRHMNGYSSHTYKWVNDQGEAFFVKYHFKTDQGIKNLSASESAEASKNPDYAQSDLYDNIAKGNYPSWTLKMQIMPEAEGENYKWDIYDVTKVWPHADYPLITVGKMVLNKNPDNYFAEVEQSAFAPTHMVPGIEPSNDKMLQGRLFSYPDTHRHRLGANYDQIPINCPYRARVANYQRDGPMNSTQNNGNTVNYEPNSLGGPVEDPACKWKAQKPEGECGRHKYIHPNDNFEQPRQFFRKALDETGRAHLIENISGDLGKARKDIQEKQVKLFYQVDKELGQKIAQNLGLTIDEAKL